jgi:hypothetical protein
MMKMALINAQGDPSTSEDLRAKRRKLSCARQKTSRSRGFSLLFNGMVPLFIAAATTFARLPSRLRVRRTLIFAASRE